MMITKKIKKDNLATLLNNIASGNKLLIAPNSKANNVMFAYTQNFTQISMDYIQTAMSPKSVLFPRCEELLSYELTEGKNPKVIEAKIPEKEVVVFGLHPCDAYGMNYLEEFFEKENPDFHVAERKKHTTFISLSCKKGDEYCFCTSVGISPSDTRGSDIVMTEMDNDYYYAEIVSEKGKKLLDEYSALFEDSAEIDKSPFTAKLDVKFDLAAVQGKLDKIFDTDIWKENSLSCLGCGACAFLCPTCSCFDIQDEKNPYGGSRVRCWDSCGIGLFTLHASGHNPRPVQSQRWRQRIMHKLDYSVKNLGTMSCVGCGRCGRACPAGMNIVEQIISIQEA